MTERRNGHPQDAAHLAREALRLHQGGKLGPAEESYRAALSAEPDNPDTLHRLGLLLWQTGRPEEAAALLARALEIDDKAAQTWLLLGMVRARLADPIEALRCCARSLALQPANPAALNLAANLESARGKHGVARDMLQRALRIKPDFADAEHNLGIALAGLGDTEGALAHYDEALRLNPGVAQVHLNRGMLLLRSGRFSLAREAFATALELRPGHLQARLEHLYARLFLCDWDEQDAELSALADALEALLAKPEARAPSPYILNLVDLPDALTSQVTRRYAEQVARDAAQLALPGGTGPAAGQRLRIAYLSPDLGSHAVGTLIHRMFERHDRARFHVSTFSLRDFPDAFAQRIRAGCDAFHDLSTLPVQAAAEVIARTQPHILIDLGGYTEGARPELVAARLAPLQLSWLGYLNTSGAPFIDYIVADRQVIPAGAEAHFSEAIARLPMTFLPASPLPVAEHRPARDELGLPADGLVFCSFNNTYKIQRDTFAAWMKILQSTPGSVLWIYAGKEAQARDSLLRHARAHGIEPERLVFAPGQPVDRHMARLPCADLFLDTFHYNAGATAVAALAGGLPLLTLRGRRMLGRMGASLNAAAGLPELTCETPDQYVERAVELASDPQQLDGMRTQLSHAMQSSEAFDIGRFVARFESMLAAVWARHAAGQQPESFDA